MPKPCIPLVQMDWPLLREQKQSLLRVIDQTERLSGDCSADVQHLEGILALIDNLQDYAVDRLGVPADQVFDLSNDGDEDQVLDLIDDDD